MKKRKPEPNLDEPLVKMTVSSLIDGDEAEVVLDDDIDIDALDAAIQNE